VGGEGAGLLIDFNWQKKKGGGGKKEREGKRGKRRGCCLAYPDGGGGPWILWGEGQEETFARNGSNIFQAGKGGVGEGRKEKGACVGGFIEGPKRRKGKKKKEEERRR